jgi:hypothetical protein
MDYFFKNWRQSFDFWIYSHNANVVVGYIERFYISEQTIFILKTRYAIICAVNFYTAGVVTNDRRFGSWAPW